MNISNAYKVSTWRLCIGCGACYYACPDNKIRLIDIVDDGIRPFISPGGCEACDQCLKVCPGFTTSISDFDFEEGVFIESLAKRWGPVIEVWEGYASDPMIRFKGSSGGLCTVLSLFCIEQKGSTGVLHIGSDPDVPWKNTTYMSKTPEELISRTGSRYSPASPCDGLKKIENSSGSSVFVGKPCDVAAFRMSQAINPELIKKTALAIGFFCAGTPSTRGTLDLFKKHNIDPYELNNFRYRGMGWPGKATGWRENEEESCLQVSYQDSWGFVQKYRPFRCYLCPDLTAEFADISVGDPWHREVGENEPGRSLILIRTVKGREIFYQAMEKGYITAEQADDEIIYKSQKSLLGKRQAIWGRLFAMKLLGIPYPKLEGFHLFENWLDLPLKEKVKSIIGTARRIIQRNYFKPLDYSRHIED